MITYKFITQDKSQDIEAMSLKKAIKKYSIPTEFCTFAVIYWTSRKGKL